MQPSKVSIPQLLADGHTFYVPFYQRAYVWTEKLWSRFIRDMEYISKTDEEYFIGSVILKKLGADGIETARWAVVDGQQRLTTLAIFYKVISLKDPSLHNPFDKRFRLDNNELTIKHSLNDKEAFGKIANLTQDIELDGEDKSNLIKAYNYFRNNVDVSKINHLHIQARLWFIAIYLEANENEHKIFDTINSLGMSLNTEELLKNHGYELCRRIKSDINTSHIPIILLTARNDSSDMLQGYKCGAEAYVMKPFDPQMLDMQVANIINTQRQQQERFSNGTESVNDEDVINDIDRDFLARVSKLVDENIDNSHFCIQDVTTSLGISRSLLHVKMKSLLNTSMGDFIKKRRLEKACQLLRSGKNVSETAYMTGFSDPNYFSKAFKKHFGKSPTEYINCN